MQAHAPQTHTQCRTILHQHLNVYKQQWLTSCRNGRRVGGCAGWLWIAATAGNLQSPSAAGPCSELFQTVHRHKVIHHQLFAQPADSGSSSSWTHFLFLSQWPDTSSIACWTCLSSLNLLTPVCWIHILFSFSQPADTSSSLCWIHILLLFFLNLLTPVLTYAESIFRFFLNLLTPVLTYAESIFFPQPADTSSSSSCH